jgi:hypothetical protein
MKIINLERIRQLLDGLPANIVQSEEQGQYELVNSTQLPTDIDAKDKASLEAAGVRFGEPSPDDFSVMRSYPKDGRLKKPTIRFGLIWWMLKGKNGRRFCTKRLFMTEKPSYSVFNLGAVTCRPLHLTEVHNEALSTDR